MIKAIFFDFDLTLVDTKKMEKKLYKIYSNLRGRKPTKKGFQEHMGSRFSEVIEKIHKESKIPKKILIEAHRIFIRFNLRCTKSLAKGISSKLKGKKIIILSNGDKEVVRMISKYHKIKHDILLGDQDMKKGEKKHDLILRTLKKLKIKKKEAIYVGDHINDIKEAHKAGIRAVAVPTGVFKRAYLRKYHPEIIVTKIKNVKNIK